ncbi:putative caspase-like protein [Bradyrhizobium sp. GM2.4]
MLGEPRFSERPRSRLFPVAVVKDNATLTLDIDPGKHLMRIFFLAVLLVTSFPFATPALAQQVRVALVIGNGAYEKVAELPNPTRDAADIGRALERLDFKVTQVKNATAQEMRKSVVEFGRSAEGADLAVVFYAGHGMEVSGENWLIPVGAELRSDTDIESEAISLRSVSLQVSKARKLGLVILDACRNNPFAAKMRRSLSTRAVARGLAPTEPSDNVLIAYAARDGTTASDGDGRNSPFTASLLRHIETPGLEISFLFRRVRDDVMAATRREQQPFVYGSLSKEEIYLRAPVASAQAPVASAPAPADAAEDEKFWLAIQTSTVAGIYEEFLTRYPRSSHAAEARQRVKNFRGQRSCGALIPSCPSETGRKNRRPKSICARR